MAEYTASIKITENRTLSFSSYTIQLKKQRFWQVESFRSLKTGAL